MEKNGQIGCFCLNAFPSFALHMLPCCMLLELCPATVNADLQPNRTIMAISIVVLGTTETILARRKWCLGDPDYVLWGPGVTPCQSGSKRRSGGFDTRTVFTRETDTGQRQRTSVAPVKERTQA